MNRTRVGRLVLLLLATLTLVLTTLAPPAMAAGPKTFSATEASLGGIKDGTSTQTCQVDGKPRNVVVPVNKLKGTVTDVQVNLTLNHTFVGDLTVTVIAPDGTSAPVFGHTGATDDTACGFGSNLDGTYTFVDGSRKKFWATAGGLGDDDVVPGGKYSPSEVGGFGATGAKTQISPSFAGVAAKGTWTIRIVDSGLGDTGTVLGASLTLTTAS